MNGERRGRGRPAIGDRVEIRLTPDQLAEVDRLAGEHGLPRSEMLRQLVDDALDAARVPPGVRPVLTPGQWGLVRLAVDEMTVGATGARAAMLGRIRARIAGA